MFVSRDLILQEMYVAEQGLRLASVLCQHARRAYNPPEVSVGYIDLICGKRIKYCCFYLTLYCGGSSMYHCVPK